MTWTDRRKWVRYRLRAVLCMIWRGVPWRVAKLLVAMEALGNDEGEEATP